MKNILIAALFLCSLLGLAQQPNYNLEVTYKMETYYSGFSSYSASLKSNAAEAIFQFKNIDSDTIAENGGGDYTFKITDSTSYYVHTSKAADKMLELKKGLKGGKFYIIEEKMPAIDWQISADTTKINNYVCYKASAQFRGRAYTAWFTPEIVSSFGPWKLHGLPGLILMAYDDTKEVFFTAEKIQSIDEPIRAIETKGLERITRQEYRDMLKKEMEEAGEKFASKVGRGLTAKFSTSAIKSIEID